MRCANKIQEHMCCAWSQLILHVFRWETYRYDRHISLIEWGNRFTNKILFKKIANSLVETQIRDEPTNFSLHMRVGVPVWWCTTKIHLYGTQIIASKLSVLPILNHTRTQYKPCAIIQRAVAIHLDHTSSSSSYLRHPPAIAPACLSIPSSA